MSEKGLQKQLQPASFKSVSRTTLQVDMIVSLLQNYIKEQKQITIDDIVETYLDWREKVGRKFYNQIWNGIDAIRAGSANYRWEEINRKEFAKQYGTKMIARQWFKNNLGSAIIRGRILAIPVIDIV